MAAAAHDPAFAARAGIPQKVAKEFNQADKGSGIRSKRKSHNKGKLSRAIEDAMDKHGL